MHSVLQAVLQSWAIPPAASFALALTAIVYIRGWWLMRRSGVPYVPPWRAAAFLIGLLCIWVALASPLDTFASFVLTAHMLQHMLLMMVAPPLLLLGAPLIPLVRGLPVFAAREFAGPFLNWPLAQRVGRWLIHPVVALLLMGTVMLGWHVPGPYELALGSSSWHEFEHACFLTASLIFWWPVVQPWPSLALWPRWSMVPYLLIADLQNTVLSAILVFSDRVLYPTYAKVPRLFGFSALQDQVAAGAIMWVVGSVAFIIPAVIIAIQCLSRKAIPPTVPNARQENEVSPASSSRRTGLFRLLLPTTVSDRTVQAISFATFFVLIALCFAWLLSSGSADDDDQTVWKVQQVSPFTVTLFAPRNLAAGTNNVSILVQDRSTADVLLDGVVELIADPPSGTTISPPIVRAAYDDSHNKLLQSATLNLPSAGGWTLTVKLRRGSEQAEFSLPLEIPPAETKAEIPWEKIVILGFAGLLVVVYLRRHRQGRSVPIDPSVSSV